MQQRRHGSHTPWRARTIRSATLIFAGPGRKKRTCVGTWACVIALITLLLAASFVATHRFRGGQPSGAPLMAEALPSSCSAIDAELLADCVFNSSSFTLRQLAGVGLVQHLATTQTVNGFTLTLWRAYADADEIAIGYTITPSGTSANLHGLAPKEIVLSDDDEQRYKLLEELSGGTDACSGMPCQGRSIAYVAIFDAVGLAPGTSEQAFRITIPSISGSSIASDPQPSNHEEQQLVIGPWTLDFVLPAIPAKVVEVQQSATDNGITLKLERVAITPSGIKLYIRGIDPLSKQSLPLPTISKVGQSTASPPLGHQASWLNEHIRIQANADGLPTYWIPGTQYRQDGDWTITFQFSTDHVAAGNPGAQGSWKFYFGTP